MTPEDVKKFEALLDLFAHPGWAHLAEELEFKETSLKDQFLTSTQGIDWFRYTQGRISAYREIAGLPAFLRSVLEQKDVEETPV